MFTRVLGVLTHSIPCGVEGIHGVYCGTYLALDSPKWKHEGIGMYLLVVKRSV